HHPYSLAPGRNENLGYILVVEDLSDVMYAQQAAAWREVAKRIAHEIKNPLTPIALSAERIRRYIERTQPSVFAASESGSSHSGSSSDSGLSDSGDTLKVVRECSAPIEQEVVTLKNLVNEFAELARSPKANPVP